MYSHFTYTCMWILSLSLCAIAMQSCLFLFLSCSLCVYVRVCVCLLDSLRFKLSFVRSFVHVLIHTYAHSWRVRRQHTIWEMEWRRKKKNNKTHGVRPLTCLVRADESVCVCAWNIVAFFFSFSTKKWQQFFEVSLCLVLYLYMPKTHKVALNHLVSRAVCNKQQTRTHTHTRTDTAIRESLRVGE